MTRPRSAPILPLLLVGLLATACGPAARTSPTPTVLPSSPPSTSSPNPTSTPSPIASPGPVGDGMAAAERVVASDPRFAGIRPRDPSLVGQVGWYEVQVTTAGFHVTITIGWGDCPAGCIDQHTWTYDVSKTGIITLVSEAGPSLPPGLGGGGTTTGRPTLEVTLVAGPVCPVETTPPDPNCAPRPVAGATVVVLDRGGAEQARATSDQTGHVHLSLPAGDYTVQALDAAGFMGGRPSPIDVSVAASGVTSVTLVFDTGIR